MSIKTREVIGKSPPSWKKKINKCSEWTNGLCSVPGTDKKGLHVLILIIHWSLIRNGPLLQHIEWEKKCVLLSYELARNIEEIYHYQSFSLQLQTVSLNTLVWCSHCYMIQKEHSPYSYKKWTEKLFLLGFWPILEGSSCPIEIQKDNLAFCFLIYLSCLLRTFLF